ncbi:EthD family reductase [Massilia sp. CMS3.1]|uniref:EthD family reductase n=1 Tax=Massilia sp. CMS3.1 TaxID=3373083 RepID=UPI003EE7F1C2
MNNSTTPVVVYVTYVGTPQTRFDRNYYVTSHLPLVTQAWQLYGLLSVSAFFPALDRAGTIAICECVFRDDAALEAAFAAPESAEVMADVANFTDLSPLRARAVEL